MGLRLGMEFKWMTVEVSHATEDEVRLLQGTRGSLESIQKSRDGGSLAGKL